MNLSIKPSANIGRITSPFKTLSWKCYAEALIPTVTEKTADAVGMNKSKTLSADI